MDTIEQVTTATSGPAGDNGKPTPAPPAATILNARLVKVNGKPRPAPLPMPGVLARITATGWPRRVGDALFVHDGFGVSWLGEPAALFGWLQSRLGVFKWKAGEGYATKPETFAELRRTAQEHDAIEHYPHEPAVPGHYYACPACPAGDGAAVAKLLEFFCPATPLDRQILLAAMATLLWGGPPGSRPAFMFTAATGRGKGKSKLAQFMARLVGGAIDLSANEAIADLKTRLLSPEACERRVALLDNVKTTRFSWAELESLVTSDVISGKRMYVGEFRRPNYMLWLLTLNGASLSTDMAQRVVEIALADPEYKPDWEETVAAFIDANRPAILADLIAFLRRPAAALAKHSRWAAWESGVLARVDSPEECLALILERRGEADVEQEEGAAVAETFARRLAALGYDPERCDVFVPSHVAAQWYNEATGGHVKKVEASRRIRQAIKEGQVHSLIEHRAGSKGDRGFRFIGEYADASEPVAHDLERRIHTTPEGRESDQ